MRRSADSTAAITQASAPGGMLELDRRIARPPNDFSGSSQKMSWGDCRGDTIALKMTTTHGLLFLVGERAHA